MGLYEEFWQDTQKEWEGQGLTQNIDPVEYFNHDFRELKGSLFNTDAYVQEEIQEESDETLIRINGWGARTKEWKNRPGVPEHLSFDLKSEDIWRKKYREPLLSLNLDRFESLDLLRSNYQSGMAGDRFSYYYNILHVEIMRRSMGDLVMLEAMCLHPDWIHDFCDVMSENIIKHLKYILDEIGIPDGIWMYEDMGYTQAPFFSPQMYKELIFPYHKRIGDFIHSYGLPFILHSCGNIRPLLPFLLKTGIDCLQAIEAKAGQDVVEMAAFCENKIAFMGNLDIRAFESNDKATLEGEISRPG